MWQFCGKDKGFSCDHCGRDMVEVILIGAMLFCTVLGLFGGMVCPFYALPHLWEIRPGGGYGTRAPALTTFLVVGTILST